MDTKKQRKRICRQKGFGLIEALTLLFLFAVITVSFYAVFSSGTMHIIESKNRLGAIAVANTKMEIVRNLEYDAIGTKHPNGSGGFSYGIPAGDILEDETVAVNTRTFSVHTFVQFIDDPFDGKASGTTPIDIIPNDYKRVKIEVSWGAGGGGQTIALVASFAPKGMEVSAGGGVLALHIIDDTGASVPSVAARIVNGSVSPSVDITTVTDATGNLILPGAAASQQAYRIEISKNGYYPITTYAPYPTSSFYPDSVHASVVNGAFNQKTLSLNRASDITLTTKDPFGTVLHNIGFQMIGGLKIGNDINTTPLYAFDQVIDSGASGTKTLSAQSHGVYTLTLSHPEEYSIVRIQPGGGITSNTFSVTAGENIAADIILANKSVPSVLLTVNDADGAALPDASVHLVNAVSGYDATVVTDSYGQAYFPKEATPFLAGDYTYTVSLNGYHDATGSVTVGLTLQLKSLTLTSL